MLFTIFYNKHTTCKNTIIESIRRNNSHRQLAGLLEILEKCKVKKHGGVIYNRRFTTSFYADFYPLMDFGDTTFGYDIRYQNDEELNCERLLEAIGDSFFQTKDYKRFCEENKENVYYF